MKKTRQLLKALLAACIMILCMAGFDTPASAATKKIAANAEYEIGDTIDFCIDSSDPLKGSYVKTKGDNDEYILDYFTGKYVLEYLGYDSDTHEHTLRIGSDFETYYVSDIADPPFGIVCSDASGTEADPFTFEVILPRASITNPPTAKTNLIFTGYGQELVNPGSGFIGATDNVNKIYYLVSEDSSFTPEASSKYKSIARGTDAKTYYVWYFVDHDHYHSESIPACVTVTIKPRDMKECKLSSYTSIYEYTGNPITPSFSINYLIYNLTSSDYTIKYEKKNSQSDIYEPVSELKDIGSYHVILDGKGNFNGSYSYDVEVVKNGSTKAVAIGEEYYTGDIINFGKETYVSLAASPNSLFCINGGQEVIYNGYNTNTQMHSFSLGTSPVKMLCPSPISDSPQGIILISGSGTATDPYIIALIKPAASIANAPTAKENLVYTGTEQNLIDEGSGIAGGTGVYYQIGDNDAVPPESDRFFNKALGTEAKTYYVWYIVYGDENHATTKRICIPVTIAPRNLNDCVVASYTNTYEHTGDAIIPDIVLANMGVYVTESDYTVKYEKKSESSGIFAPIDEIKDSGSYHVILKGKGNYTGERSFDVIVQDEPLFVKDLAINEIYEIGDCIDFGTGFFVKVNYNGEKTVYQITGKQTLKYNGYDSSTNIHTLQLGSKFYIHYYSTTDEVPCGMGCIAGTGTQDDPFEFGILPAKASITNPPTAKTGLVFTGSLQELVNPGSGFIGVTDDDFKVGYLVTDDPDYIPKEGDSVANIALGTDAKTYYVWYFAEPDPYHSYSDPGCVTVTIDPRGMEECTLLSYTGIYEYTGNKITPKFLLAYNGNSSYILGASNYSITYEKKSSQSDIYIPVDELKDIGSYHIVLEGKGNFTGSYSFDVEVVESGRTKDVALGGKYYTGDILRFEEDTYVSIYIKGSITGIIHISDEHELIYDGYDTDTQIHSFTVGTTPMTLACSLPISDPPQGIECISGSGTIDDPYHFGIIKPAASITEAPTAKKNLVFTGGEQELVDGGSGIKGGIDVYYQIGDNDTTRPEGHVFYSKALGTDAKTYYVWYLVNGDEYHSDSECVCIPVTIRPKDLNSCRVAAYYDTYEYTGDVILPDIVLANISAYVTENDYNIRYEKKSTSSGKYVPVNEIRELGSYHVILQGKGNYTGEISFDVTVTDEPIAVKKIAVGEKYYIGDIINFGDESYVNYVTLSDSYMISGRQRITYNGYDTDTQKHTVKLGYILDIKNKAPLIDVPIGITCISGTGTKDDPYVLALMAPYASISEPPTAKENLVYTGEPQVLLNEGNGIYGGTKLIYAISQDPTIRPADTAFASSPAAGIDATTYYVWYAVVGDENHNTSIPVCISVKIAPENLDECEVQRFIQKYRYTGEKITPNISLTYNGKNITENDYTISYEIKIPESGEFKAVAEIKDAGDYRIILMGKGNYTGIRTLDVTVSDEPLKEISYIGEDGKPTSISEYTEVTSVSTAWSGFMVVNDDVTINGDITFADNVNLILCDGKKLTIKGTCGVGTYGYDLTIFGQEDQTGVIEIDSVTKKGQDINCHNLTVNGGIVIAPKDGLSVYNNFTLNRGTIDTFSRNYMSAIRTDNTITINGGSVTAIAQYDNYTTSGIGSAWGGINIGWTNPSDRIKVSSLHPNVHSTVNFTKSFLTEDLEPVYWEKTGYNIDTNINNKTLIPACKVTFMNMGSVYETSYILAENGKVSKPTEDPAYGNYEFLGWYKNDKTFDFEKDTITEDTVLTAWYIVPVTITADDKIKNTGTDDPSLSATVEGRVYNSPIKYSLKREAGETAGTYVITPYGAEQQNITSYGKNILGVYRITYKTGTFTISDAEPIYYIDEDGSEKAITNYNLVSADADKNNVGFIEWYGNMVVKGDVTITDPVTYIGDTNLILCDGATLTIENNRYGILENDMMSHDDLTVFGQKNQTGILKLNVHGLTLRQPDLGYCDIFKINGGNVFSEGMGIIVNTIIVNQGSLNCEYDKERTSLEAGQLHCINLIINGGKVYSISQEQDANYLVQVDSSLIINGGIFSAIVPETNEHYSALYRYEGDIEFGWTKATDRITASSFDFKDSDSQTVKLNKNYLLEDTYEKAYWNSMEDNNISGKTIIPAAIEVYFDKNGNGDDIDISCASRIIAYQDKYGELPEPTWTGHIFDGWFTAAEGGERITSDTIVNKAGIQQTLFAHWTAYYTVTWLDGDNNTLKTEQVLHGNVPDYSGTTPGKKATAQYEYTFNNTWTPEISAASGDVTYTAQFSTATKQYRITWMDGDGEELTSEMVDYGEKPVYKGTNPTKTATAQDKYMFNGTWSPLVSNVTENATYLAQFDTSVNMYEITWVDGDNKTLKTEKVAYGKIPVYEDSLPTKKATEKETYKFNYSWSPAIEKVTKDETYTAQFDSTVNQYEITWVDGDGKTLKTEKLEYGDTPVYEGAVPSKESTAENTFTFNNTWSPKISNVTENATYTAQFDSNVKSYVITWVDGDGKTISTEDVEYGKTPEYNGETPTKKATAKYTYTFSNTWSPEIGKVTKDATYTAQFSSTINKYEIKWVDSDGQTIKTEQVEYGKTPSYKGDTPAKNATAQYTYAFSNIWSPEIGKVTKDATYTAQFSSTVNKYEIKWVDGDGQTIMTDQVEYGKIPEFNGELPTKEATAKYTYKFNNIWSPDISEVTEDVTYTAQFDVTLKKYEIKWVDGDGNIIKTEQVEYGKTPSYKGDTPTKQATAQYTYSFSNAWSPEAGKVTKNATYTAQFSSTVNKYEIKWVDGDGMTIKTEQVEYGKTPAYKGDTPTKKATAQYTYAFSSTWSPEIVNVTKDATYTAQFSSNVNKYEITWVDGDGKTIKTEQVEYGKTPSYKGDTPTKQATNGYSYTFTGWTPEITTVTGNATYTADFSSSSKSYTITFDTKGGTAIAPITMSYGASINTPAAPTKSGYVFTGWSPALPSTIPAKNLTVYAQWDAEVVEPKNVSTPLVFPDISDYQITSKVDKNSVIELKWDRIPGVNNYTLYAEINGSYIKLQDVGKNYEARIAVSKKGGYYVLVGKECATYKYDENAKALVKTGKVKSEKINSVSKMNNKTVKIMVGYNYYGTQSPEKNSYKVSAKVCFKPVVKLKAYIGSLTISWGKVNNATGYRIYQYVNGKKKLIKETKKKYAVRIGDTEAGKTYTFGVSACVNGKWTSITKKDRISIAAK